MSFKANTNVNETQEKNEVVVISGKEVSRIDYKGEPVVTFRMIDELHERPEGTAGRNFRENKGHFIENEDFFRVPYSEWSTFQIDEFRLSENKESKQHAPVIFFTKTGYLMLVKSFKDDLAWKVQRELVRAYFGVSGSGSGTRQGAQACFDPDHICAAVEKYHRLGRRMGLPKENIPVFINDILVKTEGIDLLAEADAACRKHSESKVTPENVAPQKNQPTLEERARVSADEWINIVRQWWMGRGNTEMKTADVMNLLAKNGLTSLVYGKTEKNRLTSLGKLLTELSKLTFLVEGSRVVRIIVSRKLNNAKMWRLREVSNV